MYQISNTEQNQKTASDYETKSLLYLIGERKDRKKISFVSIDTLNDVSGMSKTCDVLWDVQSKGVKNLTPRSIGKELYTLYKNYISEFHEYFKEYIIVFPQVKRGYIEDTDKCEYKIDNFKEKQITKIKAGLEDRLKELKKTIEKDKVDDFLEKVIFVEAREDESSYVKNVIRFKSKSKKDDLSYKEIFREIRDYQSSLKNYCVEGDSITHPIEILKYNKHIDKFDIEMLIVNRLVGEEIFSQGLIPNDFYDELVGLDKDEREDLILKCNANISLAFFNKNAKKEFWDLFNQVLSRLQKNIKYTPREILGNINKRILTKLSIMDDISILFLISLIKKGLENDN